MRHQPHDKIRSTCVHHSIKNSPQDNLFDEDQSRITDQKTEYPERVVFNKIGSEQKILPKIRSFVKKIKSTKCLSNQQSDKTISPNISTLATVTKLTNNHQ